ncbi:MAG: hypothetical protein LBM98_08430 [Oscillospiraceae bacterium]|nr:hypothetical protein [Oscillospiraceae bacterium]
MDESCDGILPATTVQTKKAPFRRRGCRPQAAGVVPRAVRDTTFVQTLQSPPL